MGCGQKHCSVNCSNVELKFLNGLHDFPSRFCTSHYAGNAFATYDDGDLDAWESEARRWARVYFLAIKEERHLIPMWTVCLHLLFSPSNLFNYFCYQKLLTYMIDIDCFCSSFKIILLPSTVKIRIWSLYLLSFSSLP